MSKVAGQQKSANGKSTTTAPTPSTDDELYAVNEMAGSVVSLRWAVNGAIAEIEGIVRECRRALDRAVLAHVYAVGRCGGDCSCKWAADDNMDADFTDAAAEAAGALKCLLSYLDPIRPDAVAKLRAKQAAASSRAKPSEGAR